MPENRPCAWTKRKILPSQSTAGRVSPSDASVANRSREFARRTSPLIIQPCNDTDDASEAGPPGQLERSWSRGSSSNVRRLLRFRTCCCGRGFLFVQRFWISQYENLRFVWVSSLQHGLKVLNLFSSFFFCGRSAFNFARLRLSDQRRRVVRVLITGVLNRRRGRDSHDS